VNRSRPGHRPCQLQPRLYDYVIEGHVRQATSNRSVKQAPQARGLSVPGMPAGFIQEWKWGDRKDPYASAVIQRHPAQTGCLPHNLIGAARFWVRLRRAGQCPDPELILKTMPIRALHPDKRVKAPDILYNRVDYFV